ncbi:uncharacterized protein LOC129577246 isoform X2 [Sitodiplosis mosellana]|nr:uncharacterized protein LOC129577246 isoform X2 [Sitodiplosis mosellana]
MASSVEFLDLSYNDITTIDNDCFKDLRHLESLVLTRNSISSIELDAFASLTKLKRVNLTCNRLESFDNRIFEQNTQLISIDLSGNKFMHLPNVPIIRSASLEILDLHKSQLTHLHVNYFGELPNIKYIDLSENLLILLNLAAFATNNHLRTVNMKANRMKCDEQTNMSIIWMNRNHVQVSIDNCPESETKDRSPLKFERMQMLSPNNRTAVSSHAVAAAAAATNTTPIDLNRVWNTHNHNDHNIPILNERCSANETTAKHACQLFEICVSNLTMLVEEVEVKLQRKSDNNMLRYDPVRFHHTWYDFVTVQVAFYGGLFIGTIFGAIMLFTMKLISDCVTMSSTDTTEHRVRRKRRNRSRQSEDHNDQIVVNNNSALSSERTTSVVRRNEMPDEASYRQLPRQTSTSFFAIFYERPVRRRYYRQINRSATNLVRRLSQSRLFLNSTRAQNAAQRNQSNRRYRRQASTRTTIEPEAEPMCDGLNEVISLEVTQDELMSDDGDTVHRNCGSTHSLNVSNENHQNAAENRLSAIRACASESDIFGSNERSETPPPPYNIVVHSTKTHLEL